MPILKLEMLHQYLNDQPENHELFTQIKAIVEDPENNDEMNIANIDRISTARFDHRNQAPFMRNRRVGAGTGLTTGGTTLSLLLFMICPPPIAVLCSVCGCL